MNEGLRWQSNDLKYLEYPQLKEGGVNITERYKCGLKRLVGRASHVEMLFGFLRGLTSEGQKHGDS